MKSFILLLVCLLSIACDDVGSDVGSQWIGPADFSQATAEELKNRAYVLNYIDYDAKNLSYVSDEFKNDKEIVSKAVAAHGSSLQYASDELKDDKEIVSIAVEDFGIALKYASERLRDDKDVVLIAVKAKELVLVYASERLKGDQEVGLAAVNKFGGSLAIVSTALRKDASVIKSALENANYSKYKLNEDQTDLVALEKDAFNDGSLIELLDEETKKKEEHILSAISNFYPTAYTYAENADSFDFAKKAVATGFYQELYDFIPSELLADKEKMIDLIDAHHEGLIKKIKDDVYSGRSCAYYLNLRGDEDCSIIVDVYLYSSVSPLVKANEMLKNDPELIDLALDGNGLYLSQLPTFSREQALKSVAKNSIAYLYLSNLPLFSDMPPVTDIDYQYDEEIILTAISSGNLWYDAKDCKADLETCTNAYSIIQFLAPDLPNLDQMILKAMDFSPFEACFAPEILKNNQTFRRQVLEKTPEAQQEKIATCLMPIASMN
jgi:hypothetical protein